jgi:hypothetical protein
VGGARDEKCLLKSREKIRMSSYVGLDKNEHERVVHRQWQQIEKGKNAAKFTVVLAQEKNKLS